MKKILFILCFALLIPFMSNAQNYHGVKSLYANSEEVKVTEDDGEKAGWLSWFVQFSWYSVFRFNTVPINVGMFNRFEPADLTDYAGQYITRIGYYWPNSTSGDNVNIIDIGANPHARVYKGGSLTPGYYYEPGVLEVDQVAPMPSSSTGWKTVYLNSPFLITGNEEICFGMAFYEYLEGYIVASTVTNPHEFHNPDNYKPYKSDIWWQQLPDDEELMFSNTDDDPEEGISWLVRAYLEDAANCGLISGLTVSYDDNCDAVMSWNPPADNPNAVYNIYRNTSKIESNITGTSYTDNGNFNRYITNYWGVKAVCEDGSESLLTLKYLDACATCSTPTNLLVSPVEGANCTAVKLTWKGTDIAEKYEIWRNDVRIATIDAAEEYIDTDLPGPGNNTWKVKALCKNNGSSDFSLNKSYNCVGINENVISFSIVPNPAVDKITISSTTNYNTIEVINFLGQTIISQVATGMETTVDVSNLTGGVYFVRMVSDNGTSVQKFVKK